MKRSNIILRSINVDGNMVKYNFEVSADIKKYFTTTTLFIEYDTDMTEIPQSILSVPFVSIFMAFAWITNSALWVDELDYTFYNAIPQIKSAYQDIYYHYPLTGRIVAANFKKNRLTNSKDSSLMLFSGGADCHASLIRLIDKHPLLFNIQGWYATPASVDHAADADKRDITDFAAAHNFSSAHVRSNFAKIIAPAFDDKYHKKLGDAWWHGFVHSLAFISISIPYAYKHSINEIIIASSLTTGQNKPCASNSTTDSAFKYAHSGEVLHDGFELSRQDKIHVICQHQKKINRPYHMRVCSFNDHNCCKCEKCLRTISAIVAEGSDPRLFGFDIEGDLTAHWQKVLDENAALMGFRNEQVTHWPFIHKRMKENFSLMTPEQQQFTNWFMTFDFDKAKRQGLRKYYRENFFKILKRKFLKN